MPELENSSNNSNEKYLKKLATGHYDMTVAEIPDLYSYIEIREDGKTIQDDKEIGEWSVKDEVIIITYFNKDHGHTALTFEDKNTLVGENRWLKGGHLFSWTMKRVHA